MMTLLFASFLSKNALIRCPPLTSQSPRRGPYCRVYNPSRHFIKARRLRNTTYNTTLRAPLYTTFLPLHYPSTMRCNYNRLNLSPANRLEVFNRLFIGKPHGISGRRDPYSNPMRPFRGLNPDNCSRADVVRTILPSKHKLRTNPYPDDNFSSRPPSNLTFNSNMMVRCFSSQPCTSPASQPDG